MKLPYTTTLIGMNGYPITVQQESTDEKTGVVTPAKLLTFKDVLLTAFSVNHKDDDNLKPAEKYALGKMGYDIGKEADFTTEEVLKIKERVGLVMIPSYIYPVWDIITNLLDPRPAATEGEVHD